MTSSWCSVLQYYLTHGFHNQTIHLDLPLLLKGSAFNTVTLCNLHIARRDSGILYGHTVVAPVILEVTPYLEYECQN